MTSPQGHPFWASVAWPKAPVCDICSAQAWAPAARLSLHTSGGTPTAARSLLCTARMLLAQSALIFPVLLLTCDALAGGACAAGGGGGVSVVAGGGVSVAGGGGGVSVVAGGGACAV